ncbi:MAG: beta strand repeat-containing protein, partial [Halobacteriaceae archaeon]
DTFRVNQTRTTTPSGNVTAINASHSGSVNLDINDINISADGGNITVGAAKSVQIQNVTFVNATDDAINITADPIGGSPVAVTHTTIQNLTNGDGIRIADGRTDLVNVSNNTIVGNPSALGPTTHEMEGINITQIGKAGGSDSLLVNDNRITNIGNSTALQLNETKGTVAPATVNITDNTLKGGTQFVGLGYNLTDAVGSNITGNVIVGANVNGGANSIGIDFQNVTVQKSGEGLTQTLTQGQIITFKDNVITGHARLINARDSEVFAGNDAKRSDYQNFITTSAQTGNNSFGTLINGTENKRFAEVYGSDNELESGNVPGSSLHYLPGSIDQALQLIDDGNATNHTELLIEDPTDGGIPPGIANNVNTYEDAPIDTPDLDEVLLIGESRSSVVVDSYIDVNASQPDPFTPRTNNYTFKDFQLDSDRTGPSVEAAIDLGGINNSQTTIANLEITSQTNGINISASEADVKVTKVINSDITVEDSGTGTQGIIFGHDTRLAGVNEDERDGFVIHDTTITGPGIDVDGSSGLNMSEMNVSSKPSIPVQINITQNFITGFERQVETPTRESLNETNITALNFTSEQFENNFDISDVDEDLNISENEFGQQVLVFNTSAVNYTKGGPNADPDRVNAMDNHENLTLNATDVFGSIDAAVDTVSVPGDQTQKANSTVRVYATTASSASDRVSPNYDGDSDGDVPATIANKDVTEYDEFVNITAQNVTIRGPSFQRAGDASLDGPDALINGTVEFHEAGDSDSRATFTGFTVIAPDNASDATRVGPDPKSVGGLT